MQAVLTAEGQVFYALCKSVDTPVSLGAWLRFKYSQSELATMSIRPERYNSASAFQLDYSVVSLLSKWKGLVTGVDLEAVALQSFKSSEEQCAQTNRRLRSLSILENPGLGEVEHLAQRKIAKLLGAFDLDKVRAGCGWGPGATTDLSRRRAFLDTKICEVPIPVSRSARAILREEIESDLHWSEVVLGVMPSGPFSLLDSCFIEENCSNLTTVPKNAKTHRVIAIEPRGNSFLQKGCGEYVRRKLRTAGIDLNDQGHNQHLARIAHNAGLATIDLKSASDSVSKELVWTLLPYDWAAYLDSIRVRYTRLPDGSVLSLEKFSSMGNGFTFELETLIFWAISLAVKQIHDSEGDMSVYGDDIIVGQDIAEDLISVLSHYGFTTNVDKTFVGGRFFESCGQHFFDGFEVTPAYQKDVIDNERDLLRLGNRLMRMAIRFAEPVLHPVIVQAWKACFRQRHPSAPLCFLPLGSQGDDGWLLPSSEIPEPFRNGFNPNRGFRCRVWCEGSVAFPAHEGALLAYSLRRGVVTQAPYLGDISRDSGKYHISFRWVQPDPWYFGQDLT